MSIDSYGTPVLIGKNKKIFPLERVSLSEKVKGAEYNEEFIRDLAFNYPSCLPIDEIDRAFVGAIPVCTELNTPAGRLDALFVTPSGRLIVLEAKLWKNPEARRKVVAQVLDYAKELARWDYEDLQREVRRRLGQKGNALFEIVRKHHSDLDEARFVDEVHSSLKRGRFLLLIVGDGIREGAGAIADFLSSVGNLEFTFGLAELALYREPEFGLLVQPRVIARTVELGRVVVQLPVGATLGDSDMPLAESQDLSEEQKFYIEFWTELLSELQLDDTSQKMANIAKSTNIYFPMPPSGDVMWISAYFSKSTSSVGVYIRFAKEFGLRVFDVLKESKEEIDRDLGIPVVWKERDEDKRSINSNLRIRSVHDQKNRDQIKSYFSDTINRFVNTFRHRIERNIDRQH